MESEEPKITFESIMRNWNARYNYGAKAQAQQSPKMRALNATMRNPETPAGTYPVFEAYLGVDVIEKATRLKRERKQKRKAFWKKTALWVAIRCPRITDSSLARYWCYQFHIQREAGATYRPFHRRHGNS